MSEHNSTNPGITILYAYCLLVLMFLPLMISGPQQGVATTTPFVVAEDTLTLMPNGAGTYHEWLDHGTGYEDVDENPHDGETTYIQEATATSKETFTFEDHTTETDTITRIRVYAVAEYWYDVMNISLMLRNATNQVGDSQAIAAYPNYSDYYQEWTTNPYTGNPWTWAAIDDLEAGVKLESGAGDCRVTQVRVVVYYGAVTTTTTTTTMNTEPIATATSNLLILGGMIMIPASTMFLVKGGKNELSFDKFFLFLIVFVMGWAFVIGGILP